MRFLLYISLKKNLLFQTDEDSNSFALSLFNVTGRTNGTLLATAGATLRNAVTRKITPSLPPAPAGLSQQELKRRHIVAAIIHSENSYVATLQRLVNVRFIIFFYLFIFIFCYNFIHVI